MFSALGRKENSTLTTGNRGIFVGTDKFISKYTCQYLKPSNIGYIRQFGLGTVKFIIYSSI
jgi:hypothetical protein